MTTIKFRHQGETKEVYQHDAFIEYSNAPETLAKLISELTDLTCDLFIANPPWDDEEHLKSEVIIGYCGRVLQFDFYHSLRCNGGPGTKYYRPRDMGLGVDALHLNPNFFRYALYNWLCTIKNEAGSHELNFDEFCDEFGYDQDSRKSYEIYDRCCDFSNKVALVFSDEEIATFPS